MIEVPGLAASSAVVVTEGWLVATVAVADWCRARLCFWCEAGDGDGEGEEAVAASKAGRAAAAVVGADSRLF